MNLTPNVSCKYGAPMGRRSSGSVNEDYSGKLYLQRIPLVYDGCYDKGGAYWGGPNDLYGYASEDNDTVYGYLRANSRQEAKEKILKDFPNVKFFK